MKNSVVLFANQPHAIDVVVFVWPGLFDVHVGLRLMFHSSDEACMYKRAVVFSVLDTFIYFL